MTTIAQISETPLPLRSPITNPGEISASGTISMSTAIDLVTNQDPEHEWSWGGRGRVVDMYVVLCH